LTQFPSLDGFGPTRRTLQLYARALSALARAHAPAHPNWWHISLKVTPTGLVTDNIPCGGGGILAGRMDFHRRCVILESSDGRSWSHAMVDGLSGSEMGARILASAAEAGLTGDVKRDRFARNEPGVYDAEVVDRFFIALVRADRAFKRHGARLGEKAGPVRLWPHGFDLSMEWFGSRVVRSEEGNRTLEQPAQLNLGFYPGEDDDSSYFYSNPWPFDADKLLGHPLPAGTLWHTDGWQGTMLPYSAVRDEEQLLDYAAAVFEIASPLLNED
jgi:hypothetical protein